METVERATRTRTIAALWRDAVAARPGRPAYLVEAADGWREVSWEEASQAVEELANGLLALGIRKGDAFAILGSTRLEWALFDYALALVGGVTAPIYATSSARDCAYVLEHSEAVGVLCEDDEQRAKIAASDVEHVLTFGDRVEPEPRDRSAGLRPGGGHLGDARLGRQPRPKLSSEGKAVCRKNRAGPD